MKRFILLVVLLCGITSTHAQDETPLIQYGEVVSGTVTGNTPRTVYQFDALRCDFVALAVQTTSGDLDPMVTVVSPDGNVMLRQDDADGTQDVAYQPLAIPQTGTYEVIVGRFGYDLGTTTGTYELRIDRIGNGSDPNCALRYDDTVFYAIADALPEVVYSFRGQAGDIIDVTMTRRSGTLDPYLKVVDVNGLILAANDDSNGSQNAQISGFVIPAEGTYFIFATRYGLQAGESTGNFSLTLREAANSGLGNSPLAAQPITLDSTVDGELDDAQSTRYYRFEARQNDVIRINMTRQTGNLDTLVALANASLQELAVNDDISNETQNSRIDDYLIPADGTYYLVATRYEREAGRTDGSYRLTLESRGNAFDAVPPNVRRIRYGTSITGTVDDVTPNIQYAFWGEAGDTIRVTMDQSTGALDPRVGILNANETLLFSDDDGGNGQNARIDRFRLPETGVYYVQASRYDGADNPNTSGSFVLVLAQIFDTDDN
jgi:hypothetical protein